MNTGDTIKKQLDKLKNEAKDWPDWLLKSSGSNAALYAPNKNNATCKDCLQVQI